MLVKLTELTDEQLAKVILNGIDSKLITHDELGRLLQRSDLASLGMDSIKSMVELAFTDGILELDIEVVI